MLLPLKRAARALAVLLLAAALSFVIMDSLPGDAATALSPTTDTARVAALRAELGLDRPLLVRLWEWLSGLLFRADGGRLFGSGMGVWEAAAGAARNSLFMVCCALPALVVIGVVSGAVAGLAPARWRDRVLSVGAQVTVATPDFAVATVLLTLLAGVWGLVPAVSVLPPGGSPWDRPSALVVPALSIALVGGAWLQRMVRAAVTDAASLPHIQSLRRAGMHPAEVALRHTLVVAAAPIAQACAATVPYVLAGTVVVENVVGFPGVGTLLASFIAGRETVAVASITAVFAALTIGSFGVADLLSGGARRPGGWRWRGGLRRRGGARLRRRGGIVERQGAGR